jgi:hypothetical protein
MNEWTKNRPVWLSAGILLGLVVGLNVKGLWPSIPLHATATHALDKFAICTGLVDDGVEALYFLDYLTGDMRAAVINPKTGRFNSFFTRNIAADFGGAGRGTGYLMVTGFADMPRGVNNFQFAQSIVYVADVQRRGLYDSLELDAASGRASAIRRIPAARRAAVSPAGHTRSMMGAARDEDFGEW